MRSSLSPLLLGFGNPQYRRLWIIGLGTPFLLRMLLGEAGELGVGFPPDLPPNLVQGFHCPLDDMERIDIAVTARSKLVHSFCDPLCPVPGDHLDGGELLRSELPVKLYQDALSIPLRCPDNGIGIVVDDDSDILVSFLIAGLVDADIHKVIEPSGTLRFDLVERPADTAPDSLSVDAHVLRDSTAGKVDSKPTDHQVKVAGEAAFRICPRDMGSHDPVLRTFDTVRPALYPDERGTPV